MAKATKQAPAPIAQQYPRLQVMALADLKPHPDSVRHCEPAELYRLRKSVEKFGLCQLPLFNARTGTVLDGDKVLGVLRDLGWQACPVWAVDLPAEWEDAVHLARNNHVGEWAWQAVSEVLKQVEAAGLDVGLTGFHESDTGPLMAADWKPAQKGPLDGSDPQQVGFGF